MPRVCRIPSSIHAQARARLGPAIRRAGVRATARASRVNERQVHLWLSGVDRGMSVWSIERVARTLRMRLRLTAETGASE